MHDNKQVNTLIRLIAIITAGSAFYILYPDFGFFYLSAGWSVILHGPDRLGSLAILLLGFLLTVLLPLSELVAAYGLFKLRPWAWKTAVALLSFDFLTRFIGAINFVIQVMRFRDKPIPPIPKGAVVGVISMWPSYIIALLCGIFVFILIQPSVKEIFKQALNEEKA